MILPIPTGVAAPPGAPELAPPGRPGPATLALVCLLAALALLQAVAQFALAYNWAFVPQTLVRAVLLLIAETGLPLDLGVGVLAQLWTNALLHDGPDPARPGGALLALLQPVLSLTVLAVALHAVERRLGTATTVACLLLLAPLPALVHVLAPFPGARALYAPAGAPEIAAAAAGLVLGLLPRLRLRLDCWYWFVTVAGVHPLRPHLRWLGLGYLVLETARTVLALGPAMAAERGHGLVLALLAGIALGIGARHLRP